MNTTRILIIEDEESILMPLADDLALEGYEVAAAKDGVEGLSLAKEKRYDLVILDIMLPKLDGFEVCKQLRQAGVRTPILMLTAKSQEIDKVLGLELGADDYVTKPFSPRELLARIRAVLRRAHVPEPAVRTDESVRAYRFAGWELNARLRRLTAADGTRVPLTNGEFSLLCAFLGAPQRVLTREQLLEMSRLHSLEVYDRSIDVTILRLRRKIERDPRNPALIRTERGAGYVFTAAVSLMR
jgi:two-component system OmpR family response regulator